MTKAKQIMSNRICIIGSSGFIGSRLFTRLKKAGISAARGVTTIDLLPMPQSDNHYLQDISIPAFLESEAATDDFGTIIHLAAAHRDDIRPLSVYHDVNVTGAELVCAFAEKTGANRIIFTSSVAVYGFAESGTGEDGAIAPFNEYGRTKALAEDVFRAWQATDPLTRCLVIVRPTVVFGEGNRGNVYALLRQIASGKFMMIGDGRNQKSMAYVENVAAFLEYCLEFDSGIHLYNYVDKPDLSMNELVGMARSLLGKSAHTYFRLPFGVGLVLGIAADWVSRATGRSLPISAIRVRKFCATTCFATGITTTTFAPPVTNHEGLTRTIYSEFGNSKGVEAPSAEDVGGRTA